MKRPSLTGRDAWNWILGIIGATSTALGSLMNVGRRPQRQPISKLFSRLYMKTIAPNASKRRPITFGSMGTHEPGKGSY